MFAESQRGLHGVDYGVVLIYLLATLGAGVYFSRQQHQGEDYFVAGRDLVVAAGCDPRMVDALSRSESIKVALLAGRRPR